MIYTFYQSKRSYLAWCNWSNLTALMINTDPSFLSILAPEAVIYFVTMLGQSLVSSTLQYFKASVLHMKLLEILSYAGNIKKSTIFAPTIFLVISLGKPSIWYCFLSKARKKFKCLKSKSWIFIKICVWPGVFSVSHSQMSLFYCFKVCLESSS